MTTLTPLEAQALINEGKAVLIDVRTATEFESAHIAAAYSIPLNSLSENFDKLNVADDKTVILQCQKGMRGQQAQQLLIDKTNKQQQFVNLSGGIEAWQQAGLAVVAGAQTLKTKVIPMPRQVQIASGFMVLLLSLLSLSGASWATYLLIVMGTMMMYSGASGWCGMVTLLMKMPWNKA
jgi:rhodanese-related sulfurtransferase